MPVGRSSAVWDVATQAGLFERMPFPAGE